MKKLFNFLKQAEEDLKLQLYKYLIQKRCYLFLKMDLFMQKGNIPIFLVSHIDIVFDELPRNLYYDKNSDEIFYSDGGIVAQKAC